MTSTGRPAAVDTAAGATAPPAGPRTRSGALRRHRAAILVGLFGVAVAASGSWIPSYWGDEAASVMSAQRSLPSLGLMLGAVDAVHGLYYVLLHGWIAVFGASEFSTRFPSALGAGAAVAGTAVLGRMFGSGPAAQRLGIVAGIVLAMLPRMVFMGAEARSYAVVTALAAWSTVLLVHLLRSRRAVGRSGAAGWVGYAALMTLGTYLFLYFAMLAVVHGAFVLAAFRPSSLKVRWAAAVAAAAAVSLPIAVIGVQQRHQLAFLSTRQSITPGRILVDQWFGSWPFAVAAWALIVLAVAHAARRLMRDSTGSPLVGLALLWLVVPTALLIAVSVLIAPTYSLRYLSLSAPAAALLVAAGLQRLPGRMLGVAGLAVVVALALPVAVAQRGPFAKDGSDWRAASEYLGSVAQPGDAVVFDASVRNSRNPRLALRLYPAGFAGLDDVQLREPYTSRAGLWDSTATVQEVAGSLALTQKVWLLQNVGSTDSIEETDIRALTSLGFVTASEHRIHRTDIVELVRQVGG